jgi:hypothetical protein
MSTIESTTKKPRKSRTPSNLTIEEYFWMHVDKNGPIPENRPELGPCWLWLGNIQMTTGYGRVSYQGTVMQAHVLSYKLHYGEAPTDDLANRQRDHLCRRRCCVNPNHLEEVSRRENIACGDSPPAHNARKEVCEKGHEMTGNRMNRGIKTRYCLVCNLTRATENYRNKKADGQHSGESPTAVNAAKTHCVRGHLITGAKKNGNRYCVTCNRQDSLARYQRLKALKSQS